MKKQAMVLSIYFMVVIGITSVFGESNIDDKSNSAKQQKELLAGYSDISKSEEEIAAPIDIASLQKIVSDNISTMQIYRVEWINMKPIKKYLSIPFGEDSRQEINALMGLIKQAPKAASGNFGEERGDPDRSLVVRLTDGTSVEILYNSHLEGSFAGVKSRKLKEALCGLSCNSNSIAIMQIRDDKVIDVSHVQAQSVQRSGVSRMGNITASLKLDAEGNLALNLKVKDQIIGNDQKVIQYGGAVVFNTLDSEDIFVAYLLQPIFQ